MLLLFLHIVFFLASWHAKGVPLFWVTLCHAALSVVIYYYFTEALMLLCTKVRHNGSIVYNFPFSSQCVSGLCLRVVIFTSVSSCTALGKTGRPEGVEIGEASPMAFLQEKRNLFCKWFLVKSYLLERRLLFLDIFHNYSFPPPTRATGKSFSDFTMRIWWSSCK